MKSKTKTIITLLFLLCTSLIEAQEFIKILPLGNSITYDEIDNDNRDVGVKIGYRYRLYQLLNNAGIQFDYVGTEHSGGNYLPAGYTENGGFPGITNFRLLNKLKEGYLNNLDADIILLEIGTNGLDDSNVETNIIHLNSILNEIDAYETRASKVVHVFLAQIVNRANANPLGNHPATSRYNELVAKLKTDRPNDHITIVNMETGAGIDYRYASSGGDMIDYLHPAQSGYIKMAEKWFEALEPFLKGVENKPPVLNAVEQSALSYRNGDGKITVTQAITVSDENNTNINSATLKISGGYQSAEDVLHFPAANGISSEWDLSTGTLSLNGAALLVNYQSALRSIQYENANVNNPSTITRKITFQVNDGADVSNQVSRDIVITISNKPPVLSGIETQALNYTENQGKIMISNTILVSDENNITLRSATVKFTAGYLAAEDILNFAAAGGITSTWNNISGTLTLTGESASENYQAALRNIEYENKNTVNPSTAVRTVSFIVNDGIDNSNAVSRNIRINQVNSTPVLSVTDTSLVSYREGQGKVTVYPSITITDYDNPNMQLAEIRFTSGYKGSEDILHLAASSGITSDWNSEKGILTLMGGASIAQYQAALRSIAYENANVVNPSADIRTISCIINDGTENSSVVSRTIRVTPVNSAPVIAATDNSDLNYLEGQGRKPVNTSLTINDVDNVTLKSAIVKIASGYQQDEDILHLTTPGEIKTSWDNATGTLTLTGVNSTNNYQTALRSVEYENKNLVNPSTEARTISFGVDDEVGGSGYLTQKIFVFRVNSAPLIENLGNDTLYYTIGVGAIGLTSTLTLMDTDDTELTSAMIWIDSGYFPKGDTLWMVGNDKISTSWEVEKGILSLLGTASLTEYQDALRSVRFSNSADTFSSLKILSFRVTDGKDSSNTVRKLISLDYKPFTAGMFVIVAPNPASEIIRLFFRKPLAEETTLEMISFEGKIMRTELVLKETLAHELRVGSYPPGIYLIRLKNSQITSSNKVWITR